MKKVYNVRIECNANKYLMTDEEFCKGVEELILDELGDDADKVKITAELADKDHRIAVLERALKLACEPRDDWGGKEYDEPYTNYYDYFIAQAEKELKDENNSN